MTRLKWFKFYNIIFGLSLLIWPWFAIGAFFLLNSPDGSVPPKIVVVAVSILFYPFVVMFSIFRSKVVGREGNLSRARTISFSPAIYLLLLALFSFSAYNSLW